jgi:hypothetical protein
MFSSLRRLIGLIAVRESGDLITISGLPGDTVQKSIYDIWESHKIANNVFTHLGNSEVTFNRFFAPDVVYIFERIIGEKRKGHNIRALKKVVKLLYENTWLKITQQEHAPILNYSHFSELKITYLPKQMEFFETYNKMVPKYNLKGYLLGADPGTGKTLMGLGLSLALEADVVICVVPKNAVYRVWADTLKEHFKRVPKFWTTLDGTEPPRDTKYYICHFDALEKLLAIIKHRSMRKPVILLDESHNLNEMESNRSQFFIELCKVTNCQHVIWSSGTPIKAVGREATPLFSTIDPYFDVDAQKRFQTIYGKAAQRANDVLAARMGKVHYHISKGDVVSTKVFTHTVKVKLANGDDYTLETIKKEMVAFVEERVKFYKNNMRHYERTYEDTLRMFEKTLETREQWKEYKQYRAYIKEIRRGFDPVAMREMSSFCNHYEKKVIMPTLPKDVRDEFKGLRSIIKYYMLKVQGEALGRVLGAKRAKCHIDIVTKGKWFTEKNGQNEPVTLPQLIDGALKKTIFFTSYVEVVDATADYLKSIGYQPLRVYGDTNSQLPQIVGQFEKDEDANPLAATFASLSTAVPLVMANNTIMSNVPFRSYEYEQAVARTDRKGQTEDVDIWNIKLDTGDEPNISTRSHDIMAWSKQQVAEIMGTAPVGVAIESYDMPEIIHSDDPLYPSFMAEHDYRHLCKSLEEFAEMEDYNDEWTARGWIDKQVPVTPTWANW